MEHRRIEYRVNEEALSDLIPEFRSFKEKYNENLTELADCYRIGYVDNPNIFLDIENPQKYFESFMKDFEEIKNKIKKITSISLGLTWTDDPAYAPDYYFFIAENYEDVNKEWKHLIEPVCVVEEY